MVKCCHFPVMTPEFDLGSQTGTPDISPLFMSAEASTSGPDPVDGVPTAPPPPVPAPSDAPSNAEEKGEESRTTRGSEDMDFDSPGPAGRETAGWSRFASDGGIAVKAARAADQVEQLLSSTAGADDPLTTGASPSSRNAGDQGETVLTARIISTCNQLEEEPWLPVRSIVTMFRIAVTCGDKSWELLRRYTEFHELDAQLAKSFDPALLPALPPKLLYNEDGAIAMRFLELDAYIRGLLLNPNIRKNTKLHDFLGVEKHGARYGVRRYEYDSAQSEGNRYIRDNDL